jgi:hypothetical protein
MIITILFLVIITITIIHYYNRVTLVYAVRREYSGASPGQQLPL